MGKEMKKIIISGTNNRYQVNKVIHGYESIPKLKKNKVENSEKEINKKLNGYKNQDLKKKINSNLIQLHEVMEKLETCNFQCHYCFCTVDILYKQVRQENQWTLDRINNDIGHEKDNVVISCLKCNLEKKKMELEKFKFTKQLKLIKIT